MSSEGPPPGGAAGFQGDLLRRPFEDGMERALRGADSPEGPFLVAVSGGRDSVVLLDLARRCRPCATAGVLVAHVDHGLRPDSDLDLDFVRSVATSLELPFVSRRLQLGSSASEAEAREGRRGALREMADEGGCPWIVLGHHGEDQIETVLFRLLRGSAARGAGGMRPREGAYLRPLLAMRGLELEAYAARWSLEWRDDPTNESDRFTRNRIRAELLPLARDIVPGAEQALLRLGELLDGERAARESVVAYLLGELGLVAGEGGEDRVEIDMEGLPPALRRALPLALPALAGMLRGGQDAGASTPDFTRKHYERFEALCEGRHGTETARFPGGLRIERSYQSLCLDIAARRPSVDVDAPAAVSIEGPGRWRFGRGTLHVTSAPPGSASGEGGAWACRVAKAGAPFPWQLRAARPGDRYALSPEHGHRRVSRLLIDEKIPRGSRADWPLLEIDGEIAWVVGLRRVAGSLGVEEEGDGSWWTCHFEPDP